MVYDLDYPNVVWMGKKVVKSPFSVFSSKINFNLKVSLNSIKYFAIISNTLSTSYGEKMENEPLNIIFMFPFPFHLTSIYIRTQYTAYRNIYIASDVMVNLNKLTNQLNNNSNPLNLAANI